MDMDIDNFQEQMKEEAQGIQNMASAKTNHREF